MWTVSGMLRAGAICVATGRSGRLFPGGDQPWRIQLSGGSGSASAGGWCWQSHHVPPGQSSCLCLRHGTQIMIPIVQSCSGWLVRAGTGTPRA